MFQQARVFVLASASPRRIELLRGLGVDFVDRSSDIPEVPAASESGVAFARRMAREKALAVTSHYPDDWILGADTVVLCGEEILGKPLDAQDACGMLERLSGRSHHVVTAVALVGPQGRLRDELAVTTEVEFRHLSPREIRLYVASGEPLDKAGAYAIQGGASGFAATVSGSRSNVIGLPLDEVADLLRSHGLLPPGKLLPT